MGEREGEGERRDPVVGAGAVRKAWRQPTIEVIPMHETEASFSGHGADGTLDYS